MIIAIDGPAGSGKTTTAKLLAKKLDIFYLDTGATYRVLTLEALQAKIDSSDVLALRRLAQKLPLCMQEERVYLGDNDVTDQIRTPRIDKNISPVVAHAEVREVMVALQRGLAKGRDCVLEGRDITTVVFPNADFKFYLDADAWMRAERRFKELKEKGMEVELCEVDSDLQKRDFADKNRDVGSLKMAQDAIRIDTTDLTIEQTVQKIIGHIDCPKG